MITAERFKLVFARFHVGSPTRMFVAPYNDTFLTGDRIIVQTPDDKTAEATVIDSESIDLKYSADRDSYNRYLRLFESDYTMKKVLVRYAFKEMHYDEDFEVDDEDIIEGRRDEEDE